MRDSLSFFAAGFAAVLMLGGGSAVAQPATLEEELTDCTGIHGSFQRLDCYDAVVRQHNLAEPEADMGSAGNWKVERRTSGISDAVDVYMVVHAVETVPGEDGPVRPLLVVRCERENTAVIFNFARFIEQSRADAVIRIDDGALIRASLKMSASGKAFGFWQGDEAVSFAKRLVDSKRLLVQVKPFGTGPVVAEFPVEGFSAAAAPLREACGW